MSALAYVSAVPAIASVMLGIMHAILAVNQKNIAAAFWPLLTGCTAGALIVATVRWM